MLSGQRLFMIHYPHHIVMIILLAGQMTLSGAIQPHRSPAKKPTKAPMHSAVAPSNTHSPSAHDPPTDDLEDKLPYFFILHLPNLLSDDPAWSEWAEWTSCGASCRAPSEQVRRRHCMHGSEGDCQGESMQRRPCKAIPCPRQNPSHQAGKAGTSRGATGPTSKGEGKFPVQELAKEFGELESGKSEFVEHHEEDAPGKGVVVDNNPDVEEDEKQPFSGSGKFRPQWRECLSPCPYEIQMRRRWCYLGQYCLGITREIRVCTFDQEGLVSCGAVNTTDIAEFSDTNNHSAPWTDTHIGWSLWTPWTPCSSECGYDLQVINRSMPCPHSGRHVSPNCHSKNVLIRVCSEEPEPSAVLPRVCGRVENLEHWKQADDAVAKRRLFFPSSSRLIHAIVVFVLFAPPIILLFYWLLSRAHKPRYESLPSASAPGESAVDSNGHPSISADVTSALGPNHVMVETDPNAWKTV